jgi:hypothetical protein
LEKKQKNATAGRIIWRSRDSSLSLPFDESSAVIIVGGRRMRREITDE